MPVSGELLKIDRGEPLVDQLVAHFRAAIDTGRLRPGERLPTIRSVAESASVTRATVQSAYRQLAEAGLVQSTVGRGTEVVRSNRATSPISPNAQAAWRRMRDGVGLRADGEVFADFSRLQPNPEGFPTEAFRESLDRVMRESGADLLSYGHPAGNAEFRAMLAERHGAESPHHVLVTNGAQQGIELVMRAFTSPGDLVAVAVPTYAQMFGLLEAYGRRLLPLPTVDGAVPLEVLRETLARNDVRMLYVMPTFQNPTGRTLDLEQRRETMAIVADSHVPVLEDEFECELRFAGDRLPSLASMDPRGLTATVRSFSKGLFPGVRLGWVEATPEVLGPMQALKRFGDLESSPLLQAALLEFVRQGVLDSHLTALRSELAHRHELALEALEQFLPAGCSWSRPDGGMALWIELPSNVSARRVAERAAADGVLTADGSLFDPTGDSDHCLRLALSRVEDDRVAPGIERLAARVREEIAPAPDGTPLIL